MSAQAPLHKNSNKKNDIKNNKEGEKTLGMEPAIFQETFETQWNRTIDSNLYTQTA
jgi:hypothetical protein